MKSRCLFLIVGCFYTWFASAQNPIFSQFFTVPESLNAAFTAGKKTTRVGLMHRTQWPGIDFSMHTQFGFIDYWAENINSGFGLQLLNHIESPTGYQFVSANINYVHEVRLSYDWYFRPALYFGMGIKDFGFRNLLLEDQINVFSGTINPISADLIGLQDHIVFFDFGTSVMFYNDHSWLGLAVKHLNRPNITMTEFGDAPLDVFVSLHGSVWLPFNYRAETKFYALFNAMLQGDYNRLDVGARMAYNKFSLGVLAATVPNKLDQNAQYLTSVNMFFGLHWQNFDFGFSYDFNTTPINRTGGVFEFSLIYNFGEALNCFGCPQY